MKRYRRIEDMHPEIRAFFESMGQLKLDDEETPEICFVKPNNGAPGYSIAMSVAEFRWLDFAGDNYLKLLCEGRPGDEWLYLVADRWFSEEDTLRIIKLKAFL